MTALRKPETSTFADPLKVLCARAWARARLAAYGYLDLQEAVDELWFSAVRSGLVTSIGPDAVQAVIGGAFIIYHNREPADV